MSGVSMLTGAHTRELAQAHIVLFGFQAFYKMSSAQGVIAVCLAESLDWRQ